MAAGSDLTSKAIAPGSTAYGDRQTLEAGLSQVLGGGGGSGSSPAPSAPPRSAGPNGGNALGALIGGEVAAGDLPLTDGLSVGPGAGPMAGQENPMLSERAVRLRTLATEAASPQIRALARSELRRMVREPV